jgi:plasmid stabilization system protein ParE
MISRPPYYLSRIAESDLNQIWDYLGDRKLAAADRILDELKVVFRLLAREPLLGEVFDNSRKFLRRFTHGNYVIYYQTSTEPITIIRVLHGARDACGLV